MTSREQIYKAALEADVERGKYQWWGKARHSDVVVRWKCHACHDYYSPVVLVSDAGYCRNEECPSVKARAALEAAAKVGDESDAVAAARTAGHLMGLRAAHACVVIDGNPRVASDLIEALIADAERGPLTPAAPRGD